MSVLRDAEIGILTDAIKDIKHYKSLINLISADYEENDSFISENLSGVYDHLHFALVTLEAVVSKTQKS